MNTFKSMWENLAGSYRQWAANQSQMGEKKVRHQFEEELGRILKDDYSVIPTVQVDSMGMGRQKRRNNEARRSVNVDGDSDHGVDDVDNDNPTNDSSANESDVGDGTLGARKKQKN